MPLPAGAGRGGRRARRRPRRDADAVGRTQRLPLRDPAAHRAQRGPEHHRRAGLQHAAPRDALVVRDAAAVPPAPAHQRRLARLAGAHRAHVGCVPGRRALCRAPAQARREPEPEGRHGALAAALGCRQREPAVHQAAGRERGRAWRNRWRGKDAAG
ncbi:hypothetical protein OBBRIDRAFT_625226 [Obba rivulosa]|uniref:Uncharacterized protein n=1 Tax=Obba rivulosa TaxID=1052685 RepID=A0A8E2ASJ2_9APHY|nr:hypothetical protein OBBRIDRAFT_625226 [Obba rivulosa]